MLAGWELPSVDDHGEAELFCLADEFLGETGR